MEEIIVFLDTLMRNNNREWFNEHKEEYKKMQAHFNAFSEQLMVGIAKFDKSTEGLKLSDCTYRIYRDTRFSTDKSPYKRHMGVFVCPQGKKSGLAGYYFHIEPAEAEYIGCCGLFSGMYFPAPSILKKIRTDISYNGTAYEQAIAKAKHFDLNTETQLTRVPTGFPKDHEFAHLLRLRDMGLRQPIPHDLLSGNEKLLLDWTLTEFETTKALNDLLNRAAVFEE